MYLLTSLRELGHRRFRIEGLLMFQMRQTSRQTANLPAWIEAHNSSLLERCKLVDISKKGARLIFADIDNLPKQFNLHLSRVGQPPKECIIIWRRGNEVGVEFTGLVPADAVSPVSGT
jgi:PilZ domain